MDVKVLNMQMSRLTRRASENQPVGAFRHFCRSRSIVSCQHFLLPCANFFGRRCLLPFFCIFRFLCGERRFVCPFLAKGVGRRAGRPCDAQCAAHTPILTVWIGSLYPQHVSILSRGFLFFLLPTTIMKHRREQEKHSNANHVESVRVFVLNKTFRLTRFSMTFCFQEDGNDKLPNFFLFMAAH